MWGLQQLLDHSKCFWVPEWCFCFSLSEGIEERRKFREPLLPLLPEWLCTHHECRVGDWWDVGLLKAAGVPLLLARWASAIEWSFPGTEKLRNENEGKKRFLSCSRVTEFLQLPVYLKTYYCNNSFPVFIIHILSSYWLFVTTPSLLSEKLFSSGRMKTYSVSLLYSCFASWCCATPETVILGAV